MVETQKYTDFLPNFYFSSSNYEVMFKQNPKIFNVIGNTFSKFIYLENGCHD